MRDAIIISEVAHVGEVHYQVNTCFVEMFSFLYPSKKIVFNAENKHNIAVKESLIIKDIKNIEFLPFDGYYEEKKFNWGVRIIGECAQIIKILRNGKLIGSELYIWTCLFPTGHFFLNFILLFKKKNKHIIILHGELEYLKVKNKRITEVLFGRILKMAMNLSSRNTKYIVLGDNIKKSLSNRIDQRIFKRIYSILHPYNFFVDENLIKFNSNATLTIGAIGTQMLSKNSNFIFTLANYFKKDILENKINFVTIGKILPELHRYDTDLVKKMYSNSFVSQKEFEFEISKLDYIVFFYDNSAYQLCASGAIFEAIRLGVPIISIKNDYFKWLFDSYGAMGFLCDTLEDLQIIIVNLKNGEYKKDLEIFNNNMVQFKVNNGIKNLAVYLKSII